MELEAKWGDAIKGVGGGWTAVPNFLLKKQGALEIGATELNVLINLIRFWWEPARAPFPSPEKLATEMGVSERTIYRTLAVLESKGFVVRVTKEGEATSYELRGLVEKLKEMKSAA